MVAIVLPPSVPVDGMLRVTWVATLADPLVPKLTELAAVSSVDITCYLTKDGSFKDAHDQADVEQGGADPLKEEPDLVGVGAHDRGLELVVGGGGVPAGPV